MTASCQYVEQVRRELICAPLHQETFIQDLESLVKDFTSEKPTAALSDFRQEFGAPEEVAQQYMSTLDDSEVQKYRRRRKLRNVIPTFILGLVIVGMSIALCAKYTRVFEPPVTIESTLVVGEGMTIEEIKELANELGIGQCND